MSTGKWRSSTMVRIGTSCCPPPARDGRTDVATVSVTMNLVWGDFCQGGAPRAFYFFLSGRTERGVVETKHVVDDARYGKPEQVILLRRTAVWLFILGYRRCSLSKFFFGPSIDDQFVIGSVDGLEAGF